MAEGDLPAPVTREQEYLKAILDELRAQRAERQALRPPAVPEGLTELREPAASPRPPVPAAKPRRKKGRKVR